MALVALFSVKGSPGVSTTALGLALHWPNPVLIAEVDSAGSSVIAGYLRGQMPHRGGLVDLALARNQGREAFNAREHTISLAKDVDLLAGLSHPNQARAMSTLWSDLIPAFTSLEAAGLDVILDFGRYTTISDSRQGLLAAADLRLMLTRSRLPEVLTARKAAEHLEAGTSDGDFATTYLVAMENLHGYPAKEVAKVCGLPLLGQVGWDPQNATVLSDGANAKGKFERSRLVRDLQVVASAAKNKIERRRLSLLGEVSV
ncbi:hypothetical protein [Pseudactinotalea sp. Z1748]|uniref:hypothetical protein n=1 Tax=Pseudactinotalea sp. Z1748 TaxID=3413027 RepID=UPI003C7BDD7F